MPTFPTTIRLDPVLYKKVVREAKKKGLNFSNVVHLLLHAFVDESISIGVTHYPPAYIKAVEKEADALRRKNRSGTAKRYSGTKELFDDILKR